MFQNLNTWLGPFCSLMSSFTWALGVTQYSAMSKRHEPFVINFNRALVACIMFMGLVLIQSGSQTWDAYHSVRLSNFLWLAISIVSSYALGDVLFLFSTRTLGVPAALAIASIYPVWSAMAGWFFKHEVLVRLQIFGLGAVVVGVVLVILSKHKVSQKSSQANLDILNSYPFGVFLALLTSLFWSLNTFAVAQGGLGLSIGVANAVRMLTAVLLCPLIGALFKGKFSSPLLSVREFKSGLWIFILEGFGGALFFLYGLTHSPLAIASALSSLAPALSVPFTILNKTEKLSAQKLFGIGLVVAGIWFLVA